MKISLATTLVIILGLIATIQQYRVELARVNKSHLNYVAETQEAMLEALSETKKLDKVYRTEIEEITVKYEKEIKDYETTSTDTIAEYVVRMQLQADRIEYYKELSKARTTDDTCEPIHTQLVRYDRALEEGRGMVEDLRRTIQRTDKKLDYAVEILHQDRQYANNYTY